MLDQCNSRQLNNYFSPFINKCHNTSAFNAQQQHPICKKYPCKWESGWEAMNECCFMKYWCLIQVNNSYQHDKHHNEILNRATPNYHHYIETSSSHQQGKINIWNWKLWNALFSWPSDISRCIDWMMETWVKVGETLLNT